MNIWNKTIQALVLSLDRDSTRLAFHLLLDKTSLVHWYILDKENCDEVELPWISTKSLIGECTFEFLDWKGGSYDSSYINRLYEKQRNKGNYMDKVGTETVTSQ